MRLQLAKFLEKGLYVWLLQGFAVHWSSMGGYHNFAWSQFCLTTILLDHNFAWSQFRLTSISLNHNFCGYCTPSHFGDTSQRRNFGDTSWFWLHVAILATHRNFGDTSQFWRHSLHLIGWMATKWRTHTLSTLKYQNLLKRELKTLTVFPTITFENLSLIKIRIDKLATLQNSIIWVNSTTWLKKHEILIFHRL